MLFQRVAAIGCGYEDLNDHNHLRHDPLFQTAVGCENSLASAPTLCRFENQRSPKEMVAVHRVLHDVFINSFEEAPKEIILDIDSTNVPIYGDQEGKAFRREYREDCFYPLYIFCQRFVLASYLRKSDIDGRKGALAIIKILVRKIRRHWPDVRIIIRGDSGFYSRGITKWAEKNGVCYLFAMIATGGLIKLAEGLRTQAQEVYAQSGTPLELCANFQYRSTSWAKEEGPRKIVAKISKDSRGFSHHFIITNVEGEAEELNRLYNDRAQAENRIKDQQLYLFADRLSSHNWWANQLRMLFSAIAYTFLELIRREALKNTELENARVDTIRLKLIKVAGIIKRTSRRIRIWLSDSWPFKEIFIKAAQELLANSA
jgi:hypothetical protein